MPSYTRDSSHITSTLETTPNFILATIDISSLNLNTPHYEGTSECLCSLETGIFSHCPEILCKHSLTYPPTNTGNSNGHQDANIFMDSLEKRPQEWSPSTVWSGSRESLEAFLRRLNSCHPTIHFTWTISTESVEFLDTRFYKGSRFRETGILDFKPIYPLTPSSIFTFPLLTLRECLRAWWGVRPFGSLGPTQARITIRKNNLNV